MYKYHLWVALLSLAFVSTARVTDGQSATVYNGNHIFMCPAGDGESLAQQGATIEALIDDASFIPIANYPWEDLTWDDNGSGDLCMCHTEADYNTDVNGETSFSGVPFGSGYTQGDINVYAGGAATNYPGQQNVNSPDINCDGVINLVDFGIFVPDYLDWLINGVYNFRSDFNFDGKVDLIDFGSYFVPHYGHSCPF